MVEQASLWDRGIIETTKLVDFGLKTMTATTDSAWLATLPETNMTSHLKMDGWSTFSFPFGDFAYFQVHLLLVSGSV